MGIFDFLKSNMSTSKKDNTQKKDVKDLLRIYVEDNDIKIDMSTKECGDWGIDYIEHENNIVNYKGSPFTGIVYDLFESDGKKEVWKEIDMKDGRKHGEYRNYSHGKLDWTQEYINGEQVSNGEIGGRIFHMTLEESRKLDKSSDNPIYRHEESDNNISTEFTISQDLKIDTKITINENIQSNYENDYNIYSNKKLNSLIDEKGYIHNDICIEGSKIRSLGGIKKIYGNLNVICNKYLTNLGELNYIKKDLWGRDCKLKSLGKLEKVGGSIDLKNSTIKSLGELSRVGRKLNLRDTDILDLGSLSYVGGDLFLPKRLDGYDLSKIEVKGKVKYWKNSKPEEDVEFYDFSKLHTKELETKKRQFTGKIILDGRVSSLNSFIQKNIEEYYTFLDKKMDELYSEKYSLFHTLFGELQTVKEIKSEFPRSKKKEDSLKYLEDNKNNHPFKKYNDVLNKMELSEIMSLRKKLWNKGEVWISYNETPFTPYRGGFNYFLTNILMKIFFSISQKYQNEFRVSKGVPKIGEGWVSETELFYLIKEKLPSEEITNHGKPKWLGRQHVDIWFPKHKIGIEYQGLQHDQPVEFFGGEEGFIEGQKRDKRKKKLFKENNSILIEVREGYSIEDVVNEIKKNIT